MTPLIRAETFDGATGWASGSHTWSGDDPGLEAESEEGQEEGRRRPPGSDVRPPHGVERVSSKLVRPVAKAAITPKAREDRDGADVGHEEVKEAGLLVGRLLVLEHDEEVGGDRHPLPRHEEEKGVVRQDDEPHSGEKQEEEENEPADGPPFRDSANVPQGIDRGEEAHRADDDEEETGQRIEAEMEGEFRNPDGENDCLVAGRGHGPGAADGGERRTQRREGKSGADEPDGTAGENGNEKRAGEPEGDGQGRQEDRRRARQKFRSENQQLPPRCSREQACCLYAARAWRSRKT